MNIKIGILNVPKHGNKHDLIHFVTNNTAGKQHRFDNLLISVLQISNFYISVRTVGKKKKSVAFLLSVSIGVIFNKPGY